MSAPQSPAEPTLKTILQDARTDVQSRPAWEQERVYGASPAEGPRTEQECKYSPSGLHVAPRGICHYCEEYVFRGKIGSAQPVPNAAKVQEIARQIIQRIYEVPCSTPTPIVEAILRPYFPTSALPNPHGDGRMRCAECKEPVCDHIAEKLIPALKANRCLKNLPEPAPERCCDNGNLGEAHKCQKGVMPTEIPILRSERMPESGSAASASLKASGLAGEATDGLRRDKWVVILDGAFGRYEVAKYLRPDLRWSGSRWVEVGGEVQISNFNTPEEAATYARSFGFEVPDYPEILTPVPPEGATPPLKDAIATNLDYQFRMAIKEGRDEEFTLQLIKNALGDYDAIKGSTSK